MTRSVTLVLVRREGEILGSLPPYRVELPWWSEVASVVAGARAHHGADVTVLRLLEAEGDTASAGESGVGGSVVYLAELDGGVPDSLVPDGRTLADDPRRAPWGRPGGPAADLAWADEALEGRGRSRTGSAVQLRTWNLSSIWRLPTAAGDVWLKVVPGILAHEGAVLDELAREGAPVPPLVAFDGNGRVLLDHVPGENQWGAGENRLAAMVRVLVRLQGAWRGRAGAVSALGVNDWRRPSFVAAAGRTVASWSAALPVSARATLDRLVDGLDGRFLALESCGVPDTLVHGDFHPGNFRSDGTSLVLLDWGDSGFGHPLLDMAGFLERIDAGHRQMVERAWIESWAEVEPGSDPHRASGLVRPLDALRRAITYDRFLVAFEPSERPYHEADVPRWLLAAASVT